MPFSKTRLASVALLTASIMLTGCGNPEEREAKYLQRGNELFDKGEFEKARVEYKNAARLKPTAAEPRYRLGLVEEAEGNIRTAFADFLHAEEQDPHYHPALLRLADYFIVGSQPDKAQKRLDAVLSDEPDNAEAHALHAALLLRDKNFVEAEKEGRFALDKDSADATAYLVLTGLYVDQGNMEKAEATIDAGIKNVPKNLSLLLLRTKVYEQEHKLDQVASTYQTIFEIKPMERRYRAGLAEVYVKAGKLDEAEATLRAGVTAMPEDDEMEHLLVVFLGERRGMDAAEKEIHSYVSGNPGRDKFLLWLADLYMHNNAEDRAVTLLNQISDNHQTDPEGLAAKTAIAHLDYIKGNSKDAERLVNVVLEKDPNNLQALLTRAFIEFDQASYENAVSDLRAVLRAQPKMQDALRLLSEVLLKQGHADLAIDNLNQLIQIDAKDYAARVRLAQIQEISGNPKRAMDLLFLVTKEAPQYAPGWEITARIAIVTKDWPSADKAIETLNGLEGQHITATLLRAQYLAATGKLAEAVPKLTEVINAGPNTPLGEQALIILVEVDRSLNHMEEAATYIESLNSPNPIVDTILGEAYVGLGKNDQAAAAFDKAIALNPTRQEPYLDRAKLYLRDHKTDQALDVLKRASAAVPSDTRAALVEAEILTDKGQYEDAIKLYEDLLARDPDSQVVGNNLAETIADYKSTDTTSLEKARQVAEKFATSNNPLLLDTLAWVYFRQGNTQQAQRVMEHAMTLGGAKIPPQAHYHYGAMLLKAGDKDKAKAELQLATADNATYPGIDEAKKLLDSL